MCITKLFNGPYSGSYANGSAQYVVVSIVATISALAMLMTLIFLYCSREKLHDRGVQTKARALFVFWSLIPPILFWLEYHIFWRPFNDPSVQGLLANFQYSQALSEKIWLAMVAVLAGFCWAGLDKEVTPKEDRSGAAVQLSSVVAPVTTSESPEQPKP